MKESGGKSISEYLLILVLLGLVAIPSLMFLGDTLKSETQENVSSHERGINQLLTLLDAKTIESDGETGEGPHPYGPSQPVSGIAFNYNPTTGLVEVIDATSGTATTSGDGTTLLVQGLQEILENASEDSLTSEQNDLLSQLIQDGLAIADEERRLYEDPSTGYAEGNPENLVFFGNSNTSTLYQDFLSYSNSYQALMNTFAGSTSDNPAQSAIEINSSLISQLALQNFIQVQLDLDANHPDIGPYASATEANLIQNHEIDITEISVEETAELTETASSNNQNGDHTDFRGRGNNNGNGNGNNGNSNNGNGKGGG